MLKSSNSVTRVYLWHFRLRSPISLPLPDLASDIYAVCVRVRNYMRLASQVTYPVHPGMLKRVAF